MPSWRIVCALFAMVSPVLLPAPACAQGPAEPASAFPSRPIRVVTSDAGGGGDVIGRLIAQGVSAQLGQRMFIDNRGGGVVAGEIVARAQPDGYTLIYYGSTFWILPLMRKNVPYDTVRDFAPITLAVTSPNVLVVHPSVPARSVKELIALARARPGELNYASAASGTIPHMAAELFKSMARVNIVRIVYKGTGAALNELIGGQTQLMFATAPSAAPHVKSGRLRALGMTTPKPSAAFPGVPTISAAGLPGFEAVQASGMFAPARTPPAIVSRLNQEIVRALNEPGVKDKLASLGVEAVGSTPEEFAAHIKSEMARMGKVIGEAGIRDE
jgi:tripartite-type tricarboxylate transporter receptor subunit TctC